MNESLKAVLLVGGLGTRLRSVLQSTPKPLAEVAGQPFLSILVRQLRSQGIRRLVMCTGYLANKIEHEFGDGRDWDVEIEYCRESQPQGTAGALKLAQPYLCGCNDFLVLNGDSFCELNFDHLVRYHHEVRAILTIAAVQVRNASRYGTVRMSNQNRVTEFVEKTGADQSGIVNAGIYLCNHAVLDILPNNPASLEREIFPQLLSRGVYAFQHCGFFIDIGTPEDYVLAQHLFKTLVP